MTLTFLGLPLIPAWTVILKPMQLQSLPWHAAVSREARRALMRMTLVSNPPSPQQLQPPHSKAPPLQLSHLHLQRLHLQGVVRELRSSMQRLCWFPPRQRLLCHRHPHLQPARPICLARSRIFCQAANTIAK